jgi:hypothetical protein
MLNIHSHGIGLETIYRLKHQRELTLPRRNLFSQYLQPLQWTLSLSRYRSLNNPTAGEVVYFCQATAYTTIRYILAYCRGHIQHYAQLDSDFPLNLDRACVNPTIGLDPRKRASDFPLNLYRARVNPTIGLDPRKRQNSDSNSSEYRRKQYGTYRLASTTQPPELDILLQQTSPSLTLAIVKIRATDQLADIGTKPNGREIFLMHRNKMLS